MRGIRVAAERGANAVEFVRSDGSADAAAADQDSDFSVAVLDCFADLLRVVRIVVGNGAIVRAEVDQLVPRLAQLFDHSFIEWIARMVCTDRYSHSHS